MRTMRSVRGRLGFVAAAAFSLSIVASGWTQQSRPADDQPPRHQDDNDRGGDRDHNGGGGMQPGGGGAYSGYGNDYPAEEVRAVPGARAQAVRARLEHERAQTDLHRWIDRSWDDFTNSHDYLDTTANERKSQDAYNRERDRVLRKLQDDSNYRTLKDLIADLSAKMERERPRSISAANSDSIEDMLAMATVKLGYLSQLSAMESAALNADRAVQDSRTALLDAGTKSREMRRTFDRKLRRDPDFLANRGRIDDLRINKVVAGAFLESAINARNIALDYAYYVHRWDQYKYSQYGIYADPYGGGYSQYYGGGYMRRY
jgi:hypothetical protein